LVRIAINLEQLFYHAPGGTGLYTARLASLMAREPGVDCVVPFTAWHSRRSLDGALGRFELATAGLAPIVRIPLPRPLLFDAWHSLRVPGPELFSSRIRAADIIHAPSVAVPPTRRVPLVVTVHDAAYELFPESYPRRGLRFHRRGVAVAARHADVVITVSRAAADEIVANTPIEKERLRVVPNGVDHRRATASEIADATARYGVAEAPYVLWVGSVEPRKNVGTLVEAFSRLASAGEIPHHLVLAGPVGWLHEGLIPERQRARLGERLHILGPVSGSDLRALYAGADVFAFPSLHEGFGIPVLEAMVQETPVVCSDIAALREVAGGAARLVPATDVDAWVSTLNRVANDPGERGRLSAAGHGRAGQFSWERTVRETRAVYDELL
jgi:glycosyltransferase involved in cell wall biosynthesis